MNSIRPKFVRITALAVLTVVASGFASAQDPAPSVLQNGNPAPPSSTSVEPSYPFGETAKPAGRVFLGLGTDRLFSLNAMLKSQLLFQMDLTEGYDDGIILYPTRTGVYYTLWTPRIAFL